MPRFGYGAGTRRWVKFAPSLPSAPLRTVAADGWQATAASPVDLSLAPVGVTRAGYGASGVATTYADTLALTRRVREAYPTTGSGTVVFTADKVALSDYVYATDTIAGVTNNATETSPRPTVAWVMPSRLLVGNSVHWELVAFHRDARAGRQVACVKVRGQAIDAGGNPAGSPTAWQTVAATVVSTLCEDRNAVEVYRGDLDVSGLADGLIRLEAEVYPWLGDTTSVRRTADTTVAREFGPRYFLKDSARAAAPPLAYVATSGNDTTGVWSTSAATAAAAPFLTVVGAENAIYAAGFASVTGGRADGCRIRIGSGTFVLTTPNAALKRRLDAAALVIERDPAIARTAAIVTFGAAAWAPNTGVKADGSGLSLLAPLTDTATLFYDITIQRTGANIIGTTSTGGTVCGHYVQYWNASLDNASIAGAWINAATSAHASYGLVLLNQGTNTFGGTSDHRLWRGLKVDCAEAGGINLLRIVGSEITRPSTILSKTNESVVFYANKVLKQRSPLQIEGLAAGDTVNVPAVVGNLFEFIGALTGGAVQPALTLCQSAGSAFGAVVHHNTMTGYASEGKANLCYDRFVGTTPQLHRLCSVRGNLFSQGNTKGDWFNHNGLDTGQLALHHGVGMQGNFFQFHANVVADESEFWLYVGRESVSNASATVRNDPLFVDYEGTGGSGGTATVGAGGGDYRLQLGSPARALMSVALLAFDLGGTARGSGAQTAGAYA